jgi:hypothetical protein
MRFGTSDHIFNIHDVQLIIIFISLCGVNKEVKENNNNNKKPNPILAFYIQTWGADNNLKGKKTYKITSPMSSTECE